MEEGTPVRAIAKMLNVHAATLYRAMSAVDAAAVSHTAR
jgi:transposase